MKRLREEKEIELEKVNLRSFLVLLSRVEDDRVFECKTCSRRFPSFQALGGHRASHKKPRPNGKADRMLPAEAAAPPKPKAHECSICGVEFSVGQALGGHMRRHRAAVGLEASSRCGEKRAGLPLELDLNLPPSSVDVDFLSLGLRLGFSPLAASIDYLSLRC